MSGAVEGVALLPMSEAPKDGTYIIAYYRSLDNDRTKHWNGRAFVIRHEGQTVSDYDLGWALFPGYGGVPDHCFAGWSPLPSALTTPPARSYADGVRDSAKVCADRAAGRLRLYEENQAEINAYKANEAEDAAAQILALLSQVGKA
jgi:hypothetical protein